jgi:hypothetical protein
MYNHNNLAVKVWIAYYKYLTRAYTKLGGKTNEIRWMNGCALQF